MINKCFNCGEEIDDEVNTFYELNGISGTIYFCERCGKHFNIANIKNRHVNAVYNSDITAEQYKLAQEVLNNTNDEVVYNKIIKMLKLLVNEI